MTMDDLRWYIDDSAADMQGPLEELEKDALIMTLRNKKTGEIELAKANYDGLKKANPKKEDIIRFDEINIQNLRDQGIAETEAEAMG